MFIRRKQVKENAYYEVVRSVRQGAQVRQVIIAHLGPCDTVDGALRHYRSRLAHYRRRTRLLERVQYATYSREYEAACRQIERITQLIERIKEAKKLMQQP